MAIDEPYLFLLLYFCLLCFGVLYNIAVTWWEAKYGNAWIGFEVVFGVAVVLVGMIPLIGGWHVLIVFFGFAMAGTPMVLGSHMRYVNRVQAEAKRAQDESLRRLTNGN